MIQFCMPNVMGEEEGQEAQAEQPHPLGTVKCVFLFPVLQGTGGKVE